MDSGLVVPVFSQGDDLIACLNKAMAFLTALASSRVTVQQVQGRQGQSYVGTGYKGNATSFGGNNAGGQTTVVKCYNCQGEGYMARQYTQPKRPRNAVWFKEKAIQAAQTTISNTSDFQTEDLDAYDSDCDDESNAKAVLMDNLSNYGSYIISEVPHVEPNHTNMDNQSVHAMKSFKQTPVVDFIDNEITSDSNIIPYSQHLQEMQQAAVQDTNFHVIVDKETLILEEVSRSKMFAKQNDPMSKEKKVNTTPINYVELNRLSKDFGKCFVPQQELSDEQAFWLQTSHPNTDQSASSPVNIEAPKELPKSMENADLKGQIQEKVFVTTTLQNELMKLNGKNVLDNVATITNATTIAPGMFKLDLDPLAPRFTLTKVVHLKETTSNFGETQKPELRIYSKRLKQVKIVGSSKKAKIVRSKIANNLKLNHSWGSNATDVPSFSSLVNDKLSRLFFGLGHNLFFVEQFCYANLEVAFQKNTCFIWNSEGIDLLSGSRNTNLYTISPDDMLKTSLICLLSKALRTKSWLWHRQLSDLNFGTLNKLAKDGLTRGISKLKFKKDHLCSACALGPKLQSMTLATSSLGLVPNPVPRQPFNPPTRNDWDRLCQPMFDEYFKHPLSVVSTVPVVVAPRDVEIDAPSSSTSSTNQQKQSSIISQGVEEPIPNALFDDPCHEPLHDVSTSQESSLNVQSSHSPLELIGKWNKDNPLANVIEPKNFKEVKTDEFGKVLKNKAILVAQGFRQEEGIDFEESFATYDMLSSFLISQHFSKGAVDPTLFTRKAGNDLLLVQIYVDDIIFASTNTAMCDEFANIMTSKFKMSMMGKIDSVDTPMVEMNKPDADLQGTPVDATHYRGMIGSLMYLTSSRPDLIYVVCLCARYQAKPTEKHLNAIKRIFRYLKGTINMGLWYSKDTAGLPRSKSALRSRVQRLHILPYLGVEQVENGIVELYFVQTEYQLADIFTKPLPRERFNFLIEKLGMRSMSPKMLKRITKEEDE
ncbi:uncharacterized mitochondrial protein-like protein [Tanacetum coccineum]